MKSAVVEFPKGFNVLIGNGRSQAATMVLAPKAREGGNDNRHKGADQWLYVAEGRLHQQGRGAARGRTPLSALNRL